MIERLLLAFAILAAVCAFGFIVRSLVGTRSATLTAMAVLPVSESSAARLLLFSSVWCAECAVQRQVVEESRGTWPHPIEVSYHDAVADGELARTFGILTVPALVVARGDGRIVGVKQGLVDGDRLRSLIEAAA